MGKLIGYVLAVFAVVSLCGVGIMAGDKDSSAESVAKVSQLSGGATATGTDGEKRKLEADSPLYMGDELLTSWRGKIEITFADDTKISLGPKAKLVIDSFLFKEGDKESHCKTSLTKGTFEVVSGAIGKIAPDKVAITTPTATIGIRGTACLGLASSKETTVVYTEGTAISVTNEKGQELLQGESGMGNVTKAGEAPGKPRKFTQAQISRMLKSVRMGTRAGHRMGVGVTGGGNIAAQHNHSH